ncbi:type II toxin-antitoxin system RelE/ParE family toxin [Herbaspirillum sp. WKF16]|uniref:type II toxin-antitoxin system RelE family toxin n=1 Tax=Herbaspirillum sp. WKF16 TaxID=3028312 RepID=UPI0023A93F7C|nr:type II toxin-antitoxin system RelE/ParE family toxin [Herbaspirillum sp. WKF16]WDZ98089.1 type II toxin-antitoxin system RelE/ParE family toxin [Herbaspirillum sp. WKF16]
MNSIHWFPKAARQLRNLEQHVRTMIVEAVATLRHMPDCGNVRALSSHAFGYRLRVENYRVLFDWDDGIRIVEIQEMGKHDERMD